MNIAWMYPREPRMASIMGKSRGFQYPQIDGILFKTEEDIKNYHGLRGNVNHPDVRKWRTFLKTMREYGYGKNLFKQLQRSPKSKYYKYGSQYDHYWEYRRINKLYKKEYPGSFGYNKIKVLPSVSECEVVRRRDTFVEYGDPSTDGTSDDNYYCWYLLNCYDCNP